MTSTIPPARAAFDAVGTVPHDCTRSPLVAELVHHLALDALVQRHLRPPAESTPGAIDVAARGADVAGLVGHVLYGRPSSDVLGGDPQHVADRGRRPARHVEH